MKLNLLDLIILVGMTSAAVGGYRLGFLARVSSWVGLALGIYLAARFLPAAIRLFDSPDPKVKLLTAAVVLIGGGFGGQALGLVLGASLRDFVPMGTLQTVDRGVGAGIGTLGVLVAVWMLLPSIADVPGAVSRQARTSVVARMVDSGLPQPPDTLQALRHLVGETGFPRVFEGLRPAPQTGPPPATVAISQPVLERVSFSTVKVEGVACQRLQEGSGFVVGPGTVATNAHVVAGHQPGRTEVLSPDGSRLRATVVVFDPDRDLAVLQVPGLTKPPLPVGTADVGDLGAVFGHPGGQDPLRVAPAAVRQRVQALGRDLYDSHPTRRDVFILASDLRPGDSGGALVDPQGTVVGVAFAIAPDHPSTAYALTSKELTAVLALRRSAAAGTGSCLSGG